MKFRNIIFAVSLLLLTGSTLFGQSRQLEEHIVLFSSPDATGVLHKQRVVSCLQQLMKQWNLDEKNAPNVVVFHASKHTAELAQITDTVALRRNQVSGVPGGYFEVWITGEPRAEDLVLVLENLLESHYAMSVSKEDRKAVMARVYRMQNATIDVAEGK